MCRRHRRRRRLRRDRGLWAVVVLEGTTLDGMESLRDRDTIQSVRSSSRPHVRVLHCVEHLVRIDTCTSEGSSQ